MWRLVAWSKTMEYEERLERYTKNKTAALQTSQKSARTKAAIACFGIAGLWLIDVFSLGESAACAAAVVAWCSIYRAVCNSHIDQLSSMMRDLDRDVALGLADIDTRAV